MKTGALFSAGIHKNSLTNAMQERTITTNPLSDLEYSMQSAMLFGAFIDMPFYFTPHSFRVDVLDKIGFSAGARYTMTRLNNSQTFIQHLVTLDVGVFLRRN